MWTRDSERLSVGDFIWPIHKSSFRVAVAVVVICYGVVNNLGNKVLPPPSHVVVYHASEGDRDTLLPASLFRGCCTTDSPCPNNESIKYLPTFITCSSCSQLL